jgi:2-polyprenyl-6-methoxyphenol hydroxylase-like FAD-dependent oxidoreductase
MVSLGKNCVGLEMLPDDEEAEAENRGRVLLRFDDGSEVRANCVLAADGVHSGASSVRLLDGNGNGSIG